MTEVDLTGRLANRRCASVDLFHIVDVNSPPVANDLSMIRDLTAGLRVKRRLAQQHRDATIVETTERSDLRVDFHRVVADEARVRQLWRPAIRRDGAAPRREVREVVRANAKF